MGRALIMANLGRKKIAALYSFNKRQKAGVVAKSESIVVRTDLERRVIKEVLRGNSHEDIGEKYGISTEEAHRLSRKVMEKWGNELGETATEAKQLDLRRLDALILRLQPLVHPEPYIDGKTGLETIPKPDMAACRLYLDIIDRRGKIVGYEAAHKLEEEKRDILKRMYVGVALNADGDIDL